MPQAAVRLEDLSKTFGATKALAGAGLTLRPGTVHALLGGNGSGKSTAIKILAGAYVADAGTIEIGERRWDAPSYDAREGFAAGLRFVHQDLGLFDELTVAENFALDHGWPRGRGGRIRWGALRSRVAQLLERYEVEATPDMIVAKLRPAQRTMLAIARAVQDHDGADRVLILDEPTAALPLHESEILLRAVRRRADLGQTVLIVSHRMQEVLSVSDDFTVFRDGRTVANLVDASPTEDELIAHMTGAVVTAHEAAPASREATTEPVLEVRGLVGGPLTGVDLTVRAGEIVGIAGLVGSGRTSLLKTVFGEHRPAEGTISIAGRAASARDGVGRRMAEGVAYLPEDRLGEAALNELSVRENLSASVLRSFWRGGRMAHRAERDAAEGLVGTYKVKTTSVDAVFASLSGGNQQKVVLARWLRRNPRLLLLDEPTQGVDIMSRRDIYASIRQAAAAGCAVVVASSDFVELCELCDRVAVLAKGAVTTSVEGEALTVDRLTALTQSSAPLERAS
ncbi:sugar ABC transporter ATP-binding protein [Actinoplanes sp. NPDC051851]|uniref:sugar ABC transporter ATP-binding protein n=1 Tax=Actinoplanes sp. NPDC051851 TaxID=3154753 RepID=UPI00343BC83D